MVRGGELGEIRVVQVEYPQDWLTDRRRGAPARSRPTGAPIRRAPAPAAAIGDIGTHAYNLAAFVTGLEARASCAPT